MDKVQYLLGLVKDPSFAIDSITYSQECEVPLGIACEDIIAFHFDMLCIAIEEGSTFFD